MSKPVFIFSAGWRSGSTLLQRLLTASKEILIWGEAGGGLDLLANLEKPYQQMLAPGNEVFPAGLGGNGQKQYEAFCNNKETGVHQWIPCINPPLSTIRANLKRFISGIYEQSAHNLNYTRWGVKEVRSDLATASFLRELYPDAKFVFLIRNAMDCLSSLKRHNWMDRPNDTYALEFYARHWARLAGEFRNADFGMTLRHEDLISRETVLNELQNYLELTHLDRCFIKESKVKGGVRKQTDLNWFERFRALRIVKREMVHFGYRD